MKEIKKYYKYNDNYNYFGDSDYNDFLIFYDFLFFMIICNYDSNYKNDNHTHTRTHHTAIHTLPHAQPTRTQRKKFFFVSFFRKFCNIFFLLSPFFQKFSS